MAENDSKIIKYTLTRLLAGREHSEHELLKKLMQRDFERSLCIEWIEKYKQHKLQSNERFAESLIRGRANKGIGELRIRQELKEHQITAEIVAQAMDELSVDWFELVLKVYEKKYKGEAPKDYKEQQKQQRFLYSRGFTPEQIRYAIETSKE
ncbi:regulatory protein RecX [uncultured Paraglaciecola sp.]|uniref:regulatory protein RecX n=1 Tax=uncultured Paraglaciecola sp. TaxID=1765024 RepID=UPI00260BF857|nr:regulatory protein RecX [uncultured Paraglaciecola sp.]